MFPPLCFVGVKAKSAEASAAAPVPAATGKNTANKTVEKTTPNVKTASVAAVKGKENTNTASKAKTGTATVASGKAVADAGTAIEGNAAPKAEVKFFLWEVTKKITMKVKSLFA